MHISRTLILVIVFKHLYTTEAANECPKDFTFRKNFCYKLKDAAEKFSDKFVNCSGNLISSTKYDVLDLPPIPKGSRWAEYKSWYPGASFIDWSYTDKIGSRLNDTIEVLENGLMGDTEDLCLIIDATGKYSAAKCDALHYRYCVVQAGSTILDNPDNLPKVYFTLESTSEGLTLRIDYDDKEKGTLKEKYIRCYSDASKYYPEGLNLKIDPRNRDVYTLKNPKPGYYWCTHINTKKFHSTETKKTLIFNNTDKLKNMYAVRIRSLVGYKVDALIGSTKEWETHLTEYMYYATEYSKKNWGPYNNETIMDFRDKHPEFASGFANFTLRVTKNLMAIFLDKKTVLYQVELPPGWKPVKTGQWKTIVIEYMRSVFYCDTDKTYILDEEHEDKLECELHKCVGGFNEGVKEVVSDLPGCTKPSPKDPDYIEAVIDEMTNLINGSGLIPTKKVNNTFKKVDKILGEKGIVNIKSNFLLLLDKIGANIDLEGQNISSIVGKNIAMVVTEARPEAPVWGFRVAAQTLSKFRKDDFSIVSEEYQDNRLANDPVSESDVILSLPEIVATSLGRVSFVVFRTATGFQGGQENYDVNSRVISVNVENITKFPANQTINIQMKPISTLSRNRNRTCGFWKFNNDSTGSWSREGCSFIQASEEGQLDTCTCNHLTHFAEILIRTGYSAEVEYTLEKLSIVGCFVSMVGILLVGLTAALFRSWRQNFSNKIWFQLCSSIFLLSVCFLVVIYANFQDSSICCILTGVVLHYSVLSSFCWMLVAAVVSYRKLVVVFSRDPSRKLLRASAFGWGVPCLVIGILVAVAPHSYEEPYEKKSPSGAFCYPQNIALWLTVYTPITVMLVINWTLFLLIMRSVFGSTRPKHANKSKNGVNDALRSLSISCFLSFLFGLPWLFGFFASTPVFSFLFTILATFQGFVLFIFLVSNKNTRDLWLSKFKIKQNSNTTESNKTMLPSARLIVSNHQNQVSSNEQQTETMLQNSTL